MIKKTSIIILLGVIMVLACNAGGKTEQPEKSAAEAGSAGGEADTSYAFGMILGSQFREDGLRVNYDEFIKGFKDSLEGKETRFSGEEAWGFIQTASKAVMTQRAEETKQKEAVFLEENGRKTGVVTTASGLQYEVLSQGTGPKPKDSNTVQVHYEGTFIDGTVFDSSYVRGEPLSLPLNQVIPGWSEGIQLMNVGSSYRLVIPSALAYGEQGNSGIPPFSTLIFKVELLAIVN